MLNDMVKDMKLKLEETMRSQHVDDSIRFERDDLKRTECDEALERILKLLSPDSMNENIERHQASNRLPCLHSDVLPIARGDNAPISSTLRVGRRLRLRWRAREASRPGDTQTV